MARVVFLEEDKLLIAEQIFPASVLDVDEALHGKGVQPDQGGFTILAAARWF